MFLVLRRIVFFFLGVLVFFINYFLLCLIDNIFVRKEKKVVIEVLRFCKEWVEVVEKVVKDMEDCYDKVIE